MPTEPERSMLDKERKDLLSKDDMLKMVQYFLEEQVPNTFKKEQQLFFASTGKSLGSSFLKDTDEFYLMNRFEYSKILYMMNKARSDKTLKDIIPLNELQMIILSNIRKGQGAPHQKTNLLTLFATIFKHNVHSFTDSGGGGGSMLGRVGKMFKGI